MYIYLAEMLFEITFKDLVYITFNGRQELCFPELHAVL